MTRFAFVVLLSVSAAPALAQSIVPPPASPQVDLSGPRFGWTHLNAASLAALAERGHDVGSVVSQFGWQFEKRFYVTSSGLTALHEVIPMLAGLDQGVALPSVTYMVGLRTASGVEFGIGPNFSAGRYGLAAATGVTLRAGALNVPLNFAAVRSKTGVRISVLSGFNFRRR